MVTIKLGKKKLKVFNLIILLLIIFIVLYLLILLIFFLPAFKSKYQYIENNKNYKLNVEVIFKDKFFNCDVVEKIKVSSSSNMVYDKIVNNLIMDGYKFNKNNIGKRILKINKNCKNVSREYKKIHKDGYAEFMLNGNYEQTITYGSDFSDLYLISKINNKNVKEVDVISDFNKNKVGKYIISYSMKVNDYYTKRLYRIVKVIDDASPVIDLVGDSKVSLNYGEKYIEPGFIATDNYDGDITKNVNVKNTVNSKKPGTYKITYKVRDSSNNESKVIREVVVNEKEQQVITKEPLIQIKDGITYVNGVLLVNKKYGLPKEYDPKVNKEALKALERMQADAKVLGLDLSLISGYRSYQTQENLYNKYVKEDGEEVANTYSAKPGHSEHQTGLAFDIGSVDRSFANTTEAKWIEENAHLYGFIVRYQKGKTDITGYIYEPWHVRYLGIDTATKVKESNLTLEEYLGIY